MGFSFSKRKKILPGITMNTSKKGVSFTMKSGPFSTNTRGGSSINFGNGMRWTAKKKRR